MPVEEKEVFFGGAASWSERGGDGVGVEVEGPGGGALKGGNNLLAVRPPTLPRIGSAVHFLADMIEASTV